MAQSEDIQPAEDSPWQQDRDTFDNAYLNGEFSHKWVIFQEFGVTLELFVAWLGAMARPIYEWQEITWYPTTEEHAQKLRRDERKVSARETALAAFRGFLQGHPELPTAAIRPLLHHSVSEYHTRHGMGNLQGRAEAIQREQDVFLDEALHLYRDGQLPPTTTAVSTRQSETNAAIGGTGAV